MKQYTHHLQILATVIFMIIFLINIEELVELHILNKPKHKCWFKFMFIMSVLGIVYFIFYSYIWRTCAQYIQKHIYNHLSLSNNMPYVL